MFVHQNQLEHLLVPSQYFSQEQYERELAGVLGTSWHLVGTKADLPKTGDFITVDVLGQPIQIRNFSGEYHAFLNVCSHRHCLLTSKVRGNSPTLRCQYHGWEYEATGRTRKIPEASCFRPFDRENARLLKYPLASVGDLLFVCLSPEPQPLKEFLGDVYAELEQRFAAPYQQNWSWEYPFGFNWKLGLENTMESYHIPAVHPKSFSGVSPSEPNMTHILDERFSTLVYDHREDRWATFWQRVAMKAMGGPTTDIYKHHVVYPNLVFVFTDAMAYCQEYIPVSRNRSRTKLRMYSFRSQRMSPQAKLTGWVVAKSLCRDVRRIMVEDEQICTQQQLGMESSRYCGIIGTREERIYTFQKYLQERCGASNQSDRQLVMQS